MPHIYDLKRLIKSTAEVPCCRFSVIAERNDAPANIRPTTVQIASKIKNGFTYFLSLFIKNDTRPCPQRS